MLNLGLMKIRLGSASRETEVLESSGAYQWRYHSDGLRILQWIYELKDEETWQEKKGA